jgi:hypothetical protein
VTRRALSFVAVPLVAIAALAGCDLPGRIVVGSGDSGACTEGMFPCGASATCVDPAVDPHNCGACDNACPADQRCVDGMCVAGCPTGHADCDGDDSNMCEVDTNADIANCGACGHACALSNAVAACVNGQCAVTQCATGFANCNMMPGDGCEINLQTSEMNCGMCGHTCPMGQFCGVSSMTMGAQAQCLTACPMGFSPCGGACVNLTSDGMNCGRCATMCPSAPNGSGVCRSSTCALDCATGYGNCDAVATNGCETALASSPTNCGHCGTACPARANSTPTCVSGVCNVRCSIGYGDCDRSPTNGCEVHLSTSTNCGVCGAVCRSPLVCRATVSVRGAYSCQLP